MSFAGNDADSLPAAKDGDNAGCLTGELPQIAAPTLLIAGEEDTLFGLATQHALLAGLPNASLEMLPGLGHSPHWEDPRTVAQLIVAFVGSDSGSVAPLVTGGDDRTAMLDTPGR